MFPLDFMFDLTRGEIRNISQTVICSVTLKHAPRAFGAIGAMQQMTSERPAAIGFQYVDGGDGESVAGKTIRERRARYYPAARTRPESQA